MRIMAIILLVIVAVGCAGQGGQRPQMAAPRAAQTYAQPTIRPLGQFPNAAQPQGQPQAAATATLIQERPRLMPLTPTPQPDPLQQQTTAERLQAAQSDALTAQHLLDDCLELQAREFQQGWVVNCLLLEDNLKEANRRLLELMDAAIAENN